MIDQICLSLPFPPGVNNLYRNVTGKGRRKSERYRIWRQAAGWDVRKQAAKPIHGEVEVAMVLTPRDRRKRDLDGLAKAPLDLLVDHGLIDDDSKVRKLTLEWGQASKPGAVVEVKAA